MNSRNIISLSHKKIIYKYGERCKIIAEIKNGRERYRFDYYDGCRDKNIHITNNFQNTYHASYGNNIFRAKNLCVKVKDKYTVELYFIQSMVKNKEVISSEGILPEKLYLSLPMYDVDAECPVFCVVHEIPVDKGQSEKIRTPEGIDNEIIWDKNTDLVFKFKNGTGPFEIEDMSGVFIVRYDESTGMKCGWICSDDLEDLDWYYCDAKKGQLIISKEAIGKIWSQEGYNGNFYYEVKLTEVKFKVRKRGHKSAAEEDAEALERVAKRFIDNVSWVFKYCD